MARPIRETPILFGEEGRRFEEKMRNVKCTISKQEYDDMKKSYDAFMVCMKRGEEFRKANGTI